MYKIIYVSIQDSDHRAQAIPSFPMC